MFIGGREGHSFRPKETFGFYPANTDTSVKPHDGAGGVSCSRESVTARSSSVRLSA